MLGLAAIFILAGESANASSALDEAIDASIDLALSDPRDNIAEITVAASAIADALQGNANFVLLILLANEEN
jgi:hypothetical protein